MTRRRCELCENLDWMPRDRWDGICPRCRWKLGGVEKPKPTPKPGQEKP